MNMIVAEVILLDFQKQRSTKLVYAPGHNNYSYYTRFRKNVHRQNEKTFELR